MLNTSTISPEVVNYIELGAVVVVFVLVLVRRSLAGIGSLVLIAVAYIVERGSPFIDSWLSRQSSGNMTGLQVITSLRLAIVIALSLFILVILRHLAGRVPLVIRVISAATFASLLVWYIVQALQASYTILPIADTKAYAMLQQFYPVGLLAALVLGALELWFVHKGGAKPKSHKSHH